MFNCFTEEDLSDAMLRDIIKYWKRNNGDIAKRFVQTWKERRGKMWIVDTLPLIWMNFCSPPNGGSWKVYFLTLLYFSKIKLYRLIPPPFIEVPVQSQESKRSCICELGMKFVTFYDFFIGFSACSDSVVFFFLSFYYPQHKTILWLWWYKYRYLI